MSVCVQLAVADWSGVCVLGLDRANHLPAEMAFDRSLYSDVSQHHSIISEDSIPCSIADHCVFLSILHVVLQPKRDGNSPLHL